MSSIVLLGSTGSIGVNTLIIAKHYNIAIEAIVAGNNIDLLNAQIKEHQPKVVAIANAKEREKVDHPHVLCGAEGILELRTDKQTLPDSVIQAAAKLCVDFSVKNPGDYEVDYTKRKFVKLQEGSNVLYNKYDTISVTKEGAEIRV